MCVALLTKPGKVITNDALYNGWQTNPDGGGFAYVKDDKVVIEKGFMKYNEFQKAYATATDKYAAESPFLVHMRIRTSGATNANNCHPFPIRDGALIHNGIMFTPTGKRAGPVDDRKSDTRVFAESLYNILNLEHIQKKSLAIQNAIGRGNKICFLYDDKSYYILGEEMGDWIDGIWHSNDSCARRWSRR